MPPKTTKVAKFRQIWSRCRRHRHRRRANIIVILRTPFQGRANLFFSAFQKRTLRDLFLTVASFQILHWPYH